MRAVQRGPRDGTGLDLLRAELADQARGAVPAAGRAGCRIPGPIARRNSRPFMNNLAFGALHAVRCAGTMATGRGRPRAVARARSTELSPAALRAA